MQAPAESRQTYRFGDFEVDPRSGELRKNGLTVRLQDQPFQILLLLLARPGEVVTRDEVRQSLWPGDTFVDFDMGLNSAIKKLRDALSDSAEKPRFVETLPRRGYRFIAPVEVPPAPPSAKAETEPLVRPERGFRLPFWSVATVTVAVVAVLAGLLVARLRESSSQPALVRFSIEPPPGMTFSSLTGGFAISPDGGRLAFVASDRAGQPSLWVRRLDALAAQRLPGTEGVYSPFWSPDGRFIAFFAGGKLKKVDLHGGPAQTLCDAPVASSGAWGDGVILFSGLSALQSVAPTGGRVTAVTRLEDARKHFAHLWPQFLPDGRRFLYLAVATEGDPSVYVGSLKSGVTTPLDGIGTSVAYSPPGYLHFVRDFTLMAQAFDVERLKTTGEPFPVAEQIGRDAHPFWARGWVSVSRNGVLAYRNRVSLQGQLAWFDRGGHRFSDVGDPGEYSDLALSPDQTKLAATRRDPTLETFDIWVQDLERGVGWRATFDPANDWCPVWSPDGTRLLFASQRAGARNDLYLTSVTGGGPEEPLLKSPRTKWSVDWSPDGRFVLFNDWNLSTKAALWVLPLFGERRPSPVRESPFNDVQARLSPDGRWLAYTSDDSGRPEVYVRSFPGSGARWKISTGGASQPAWRRDGKELFYLTSSHEAYEYLIPDEQIMLMAVEFEAGSSMKAGVPRPLFTTSLGSLPPSGLGHDYVVSDDGQRFLLKTPLENSRTSPITVVLNWTAGPSN
jgi:Tol biopolymer transport system component/DNA-binding winged helix-turn-helix (wHTH) protein